MEWEEMKKWRDEETQREGALMEAEHQYRKRIRKRDSPKSY